MQELQEARQKDSQDCHKFFGLYVFGNQSFKVNEFSSIDDHLVCLKELDSVIKKAYEIGGDLREIRSSPNFPVNSI